MTTETDRYAVIAAGAKLVWPHIASFSGAVISLAFVEHLTVRGKGFAVFFGFWIAVVLGPILHAIASHYAPFVPVEVAAPGLNFLLALTAMAVVPKALSAVSTVAGDPRWVRGLLRINDRNDGGFDGHDGPNWPRRRGGYDRAPGGDLPPERQ